MRDEKMGFVDFVPAPDTPEFLTKSNAVHPI